MASDSESLKRSNPEVPKLLLCLYYGKTILQSSLKHEMRTVGVSWRCLFSASSFAVTTTELAAVARPPLELLAASRARDKSMRHLMPLCAPCMPGRLSLSLWDGPQAGKTDSSQWLTGQWWLCGGNLEQPAACKSLSCRIYIV